MKTDKIKSYFYITSVLLFLIISEECKVSAHSVHIGFANISVAENSVSGKIIFYKDDFFKSVKKMNGNTLRNLNADQYNELKHRHMEKFLKVFANNNAEMPLNLTGNGEDESSIWFTFKYTAKEKINSLVIIWTALFEILDDQMNILNIKAGNKEKSFILTKDDSEAAIKIL